jgi:hypothetical protein
VKSKTWEVTRRCESIYGAASCISFENESGLCEIQVRHNLEFQGITRALIAFGYTPADMASSFYSDPRPYKCLLCGQRIDDGQPCGCGAKEVQS